ncbi:TetR/AcrR family transcriptional regulator [Vreelandella boliviensis]|uniref:TetR/AcrR family transcriptional regulator n=1 Tax=Vreelandella boliviensis TaxID=223527 RepID=UPI001B8C4CD9|nr:TetR/AcrR family transcriptional regulator [Halomonas boliviensis]MBS3669997.1 TetR/AcrR family transcriptional regulator [Halomonas boliviensis]
MSNVGRPINYAARQVKIDKIIDGAVQCFVKKGFHGAGMAEISRTANVSQASLYQYFSSKNELILEIAKKYFTRDMEALKRIESASDFVVALEEEAYLTGDKTGTIMYLEILAESSRNPEIKKAVQKSGQELFSTCCAMIKKLQENGKANSTLAPEQITHYIFAYIDGLSCHIATTNTEYSSSMLRQFVETLLEFKD